MNAVRLQARAVIRPIGPLPVIKRLLLAVALLGAGLTYATGQEIPAALRGYSMIGERVETITYPNWGFDQHWTVKVYMSRDGRIFAKQTLNSGNPKNGNGTMALVSDRKAPVEPFTWNGSGVSRQWTNPNNGVVLTLSLIVLQQHDHLSCTMDLGRQNVGDFDVRVDKQNCRIFRGNAAAD